jgi:D-alanyl-D-alanine carboxypeptidase/D-alanyl-D-alanine-endopeptidase (penicillin-binding protein 4)
VLLAAAVASGVLGGTPELAAAPTPSPSTSPTASASASPTSSPSPSAGEALQRIAARVHRALRGSTAAHHHYKITIAGLGDIASHPNRASAPASNEKILTAMTLVSMVGPSYHYVTRVMSATTPVDGVLAGDLNLIGSGDPTLTTHNLARLAHRLHASGLRSVTGRLVVDDSRYSHGTLAPGWKHSFLPGESGAVDAFSVNNDNWRSSRPFLANPSHANARLWRTALKKAGIHITGGTHVGPATGSAFELARHASRPLSAIVKMTLSESINYYAEMMLREIGYQDSGHGSRQSGIAGIRGFARRNGLPVGRLEDGSGLSYANRETPGTFVAWLAKLPSMPLTYKVVYDGLATSCKAGGTLRYRMCGPRVKHKVHAKTGTLTHITSLSGYTETAGDRFVIFSFEFSRVRSITTANKHIDAALKAIVRSPG